MRLATLIVSIAIIGLGVGCESGRIADAPQVVEMMQPTAPPALVPSEAEIDREVEQRLPHGPADPRYRSPVLGQPNPELAVNYCGCLRMRTWECSSTTYSHGCVGHGPLWFADPMERIDNYGRCGDLKPALYSPARFVANLVALPVTMYVHPPCEQACTDRTAIFGSNGRVAPLTRCQPSGNPYPQQVQQVP